MANLSPRIYVRIGDGTVYGAYDPFCREAFDEYLFGMSLADALAELERQGWVPTGSTEGETVLFEEKGA